MASSSSLTEQLATLGIHLPIWPEEPEEDSASGDWIQRGQVYAEGVRLWRAQLRNAPESTKRVVDLLLQHHGSSDQLTPWDRWLSAFIHQEVKTVVTLDRWKLCIEQLQVAPLTNAQILGAMLALADAQQLGAAVAGALRILKNERLTSQQNLEVCALLTTWADLSWRVDEGAVCQKSFLDSIDLFLELTRALTSSLEQNADGALDPRHAQLENAISSLERLYHMLMLGEEDQWSGIPKARALQLLDQSGPQAAISFIEKKIPWRVPSGMNEGCARMLVAKMLVEKGEWEAAKSMNSETIEQLKRFQELEAMRTSKLDVIRAETELLSHELSLALGNRSLELSNEMQNGEGQCWRRQSRSQLGQDLWVLEQLGWKRDGYFVEFGATDGVLLSNTWLLEKHFGWRGICAEANPKLFKRLQLNRSCHLSPACIYRSSGEQMRFVLADAYGGLEALGREDQHVDKRSAYLAVGDVIEVTTMSLMDLLNEQGAPGVIDYLSIDTEGSELAILEGLDWSRFQFRCITVEHNFTEQREGIRQLLEVQGYQRREAKWDDWYVKIV